MLLANELRLRSDKDIPELELVEDHLFSQHFRNKTQEETDSSTDPIKS